jgi:hypothetical protein
MSHLETLAVMRGQVAEKDYSGALRLGRSELEHGRDSSQLLVLMATAGLLGDGEQCSLDEVREWLERAVKYAPQDVDAQLELGHFLDAVADEPRLAIPIFKAALGKAIEFLETALDGLDSTAGLHDQETQDHVRALRARASKLLAE